MMLKPEGNVKVQKNDVIVKNMTALFLQNERLVSIILFHAKTPSALFTAQLPLYPGAWKVYRPLDCVEPANRPP